MTQQVFADYLQQSPATLSSIFNGRTRPTLNVVDAIKNKFPDISIEWLLYGTGEMYNKATGSSSDYSADAAASGAGAGMAGGGAGMSGGGPGVQRAGHGVQGAGAGEPGTGHGVSGAGFEPMINFDEAGNAGVVQPMSGGHVHFSRQMLAGSGREELKIAEKAPRKVVEIRVYYDDQTYETFSPASHSPKNNK